jgi:filamentous hemagglutinin family protein
MRTKFRLLFLTLTGVLLTAQAAIAQTYQPSNRIPIADNSQIGTQVSGANNNFDITGGLQRGQNLFHSFQDFSVPTGGSASFNNPAGNRSIITRVTGNLFSDINGLIQTNGANFLLINPNGVVFGPGVRLDIGKAFVTSTANGINLVDGGGGKITFGTNANGDAPLLTIAPDVLFNVASLNMGGGTGAINNFGTLQTNNDGQYIGLVGGNINFNGGKIIAPGGRVDLGGLNTAGTVSFNSNGLVFDNNNANRSNISIANGSSISVRASQTLNPVDPVFFATAISPGSSINLSANQIDLLNSGSRFIAAANNPVNQAVGGLDAGLEVNAGNISGTIGTINLDATGDINLNQAAIFNVVRSGATGTGGGINLKGNNINIANKSEISTNLSEQAIGRGGDIVIAAKGNLTIAEPDYANVTTTITDTSSIVTAKSGYFDTRPKLPAGIVLPESVITANTLGNGDSGKISITTGGNILVRDRGVISSKVESTGTGNSGGVQIDAGGTFALRNGGQILTFSDESVSGSTGNAGNVEIKAKGDVTVSGTEDQSILAVDDDRNPLVIAKIDSNSFRKGNAGKITINAPTGKLSVVKRGAILSSMRKNGDGNSGGIDLTVRELLMSQFTEISGSLGGNGEDLVRGTAGDINITATGDIVLDEPANATTFEGSKPAPSIIASSIHGTATGPGGKVTIKTLGKVLLANHDGITSGVESGAEGNGGGIDITAGELNVLNEGVILTTAARDDKPGRSGDITIKTTGDITVAGNTNPNVGQDNSDKFYTSISSSNLRNGGAGKVQLEAGGTISILNKGGVKSLTGVDNLGNITNNKPNTNPSDASGGITLKANRLKLDRSDISVSSVNTGGNIVLDIRDLIFMGRNSQITTNSTGGGNGGDIIINSPFLIATPRNNDVTANAIQGQGGNVKIDAQGLFGIQFRPKASDSTSDITASSSFGQSGNVKINTPGVDPAKEKGELVTVPNDASKQISQVCNASNRQNKLTVTGRGGLPPNANDPLVSDVIWLDARTTTSPEAVSQTIAPVKLTPPAVGWIFDSQGKVTLVAATNPGQPTKTTVVCPNASK